MKKIITLLSAFVILYNISLAQEVTEDSYKKAVDYLNCMSIKLSLQNDKNFNEFSTTCNCEKEISYNLIFKFLDDKKIQLSKELLIEIESLKNVNLKNKNKEYIIKFLTEEIFKNSVRYNKIYSFADKRKDIFPHFIQNLKDKLKNILVEKNTEQYIESSKENTKKYDNNDFELRLQSLELKATNENSSAVYILVIVLIIVILLLFRFYFKSNSNFNYDSLIIKLTESKRMNDHFYSRNQAFEFNRTAISKNDINEINKQILELQSQINTLNDKLKNNNESLKANTNTQPPIKIIESATEFFYLSTPNADGSFNESSVSMYYKDGASIYRFKKINNSKSSFQIDDKESSVRLALQFPDKNLDPVCDALNAFNPKATKIKTDQPGEAELQNGKWVVTKKSKIRYEG
jgi:hypothetical protein